MVANMESEIQIRFVLVEPPPGVDYGIQRGAGAGYESVLVQQPKRGDVAFEFSVTVSDNRKDGLPNFLGPFTQGPRAGRFIYVNVGTSAGQRDTQWSRRMKIPLQGITWTLIRQAMSKPGGKLSTRIPGTAKDGGPNCATVKLLGDWQVE
jgi:hypothetical protein